MDFKRVGVTEFVPCYFRCYSNLLKGFDNKPQCKTHIREQVVNIYNANEH